MSETEMSKSYVVAQKKSYAGQEKEIVIAADKLTEIVLGFQPAGIAAKESNIAITAYFEPAVCLAEVTQTGEKVRFKVDWIRGVHHQDKSIRLFPDIAQPGGANRAQTVNFAPDDTLWVSRNAEREFFSFSKLSNGQWALSDKISLPDSTEEWRMIHSALLVSNHLFTIESPGSLENWSLNKYELSDGKLNRVQDNQYPSPVTEFMYGIGKQAEGDDLWFVTDFRSSAQPGIYRGKDLVVPDIYGNGICFLPNGSALVVRYGQGHNFAFSGLPGALIYVPAHLLK